jgi:hypothetical protein
MGVFNRESARRRCAPATLTLRCVDDEGDVATGDGLATLIPCPSESRWRRRWPSWRAMAVPVVAAIPSELAQPAGTTIPAGVAIGERQTVPSVGTGAGGAGSAL